MSAGDSWWLKIKRAQQHMVEINRCAGAYAQRHPYEVVRLPKSKRNPKRWRYKLVMESPDAMVAIMLGDFIHNLRSALDHIVVACSVPKHRKSASFPVLYEDVFARDAHGEFIHPDAERREDFRTALRGLERRAHPLAMVLAAQPYKSADPANHIFGILSRLENADKHRRLIAVGAGLRGATMNVTSRGIPQSTHGVPWHQFLYADAQVLSFTVANPSIVESDVKVQAHGTASINIEVTGIGGNESATYNLRTIMLKSLRDVRLFLKMMEPYVIR